MVCPHPGSGRSTFPFTGGIIQPRRRPVVFRVLIRRRRGEPACVARETGNVQEIAPECYRNNRIPVRDSNRQAVKIRTRGPEAGRGPFGLTLWNGSVSEIHKDVADRRAVGFQLDYLADGLSQQGPGKG